MEIVFLVWMVAVTACFAVVTLYARSQTKLNELLIKRIDMHEERLKQIESFWQEAKKTLHT